MAKLAGHLQSSCCGWGLPSQKRLDGESLNIYYMPCNICYMLSAFVVQHSWENQDGWKAVPGLQGNDLLQDPDREGMLEMWFGRKGTSK